MTGIAGTTAQIDLTTRLLLSMVTAMVAFEPWYRPDGDQGQREFMAERMARLILEGMRMDAPPGGGRTKSAPARRPSPAKTTRSTRSRTR